MMESGELLHIPSRHQVKTSIGPMRVKVARLGQSGLI